MIDEAGCYRYCATKIPKLNYTGLTEGISRSNKTTCVVTYSTIIVVNMDKLK